MWTHRWSQTETGRPSATVQLEIAIAVMEPTHLVTVDPRFMAINDSRGAWGRLWSQINGGAHPEQSREQAARPPGNCHGQSSLFWKGLQIEVQQ